MIPWRRRRRTQRQGARYKLKELLPHNVRHIYLQTEMSPESGKRRLCPFILGIGIVLVVGLVVGASLYLGPNSTDYAQEGNISSTESSKTGGVWATWSLWTECQRNCWKERSRTCASTSRNQRVSCQGVDFDVADCQTSRCTAKASGDFSESFTQESKDILKMKSLERRMLVRDTMRPQEVEIAWEQFSRCGLAYCSEKYLLADFFENGDKRFPVVKLFVAKSLGLPSRFFTGGYSSGDSMLHFGIHLPKQGGRSGDMSAIFFVIHPNSWGPYQYRFLDVLGSAVPSDASGTNGKYLRYIG